MEHITLLATAIALLVLCFACLRWGVDSTDGIDSPEWELRQHWPGVAGRDWPRD